MSENKEICLLCGEGSLTPGVEKNCVTYNGHSKDLDSHFSKCDSCLSVQTSAEEMRINKRLMVAFRKQTDGLLQGEEIKRIREELELTQREAADVFGGGPVAFSKYENNDVTQSEAMDKLLRLAISLPNAFELLNNWRDKIQLSPFETP